ncbi:hypothetical protein, partial [uncultured Gammaproteobacteria bacterium]
EQVVRNLFRQKNAVYFLKRYCQWFSV